MSGSSLRRGFLAGVLALGAWPAGALDIVNYSNTIHDRFTPGSYPSSPTNNPDFWFSSLDWSGVGWNVEDPRKSVAMISPMHFVAAAHFAVGGNLSFLNGSGERMTFGISGTINGLVDPVTGSNSDLYVGELTAPIPAASNIMSYALMSLPATNDYVGLPLLIYGYTPQDGIGGNPAVGAKVGTNVFGGFAPYLGNPLFWYDQDPVTGEAYGQAGDSGSPAFTLVGSTLAVLGTHYLIGEAEGNVATFDTFAPNYLTQIGSILQADGYSLLLIPEPWVGLPLLGGVGLMVWLRRRAANCRALRLGRRAGRLPA